MSTTIPPRAALHEEATAVLVRELGVIDTIRFLLQFRSGTGDYSKERGQWLDTNYLWTRPCPLSRVNGENRVRPKTVPSKARVDCGI
jgi:hypothetical protein